MGQPKRAGRGTPPGQTREVVRRLTAQGKTPREIAAKLGISTQAVYDHLKRIKNGDAA